MNALCCDHGNGICSWSTMVDKGKKYCNTILQAISVLLNAYSLHGLVTKKRKKTAGCVSLSSTVLFFNEEKQTHCRRRKPLCHYI